MFTAAADIRGIPVISPSGMDCRADSPEPWELLINIAPHEQGWLQRPGSALVYRNALGSTLRYRAVVPFRFKTYLLCVGVAVDDDGEAALTFLDGKGRDLGTVATSDIQQGLGAQNVTEDTFWGRATLGNRVFLCNNPLAGAVCLGADKTGIEDPVALVVAGNETLYLGPVSWQAGDDASNWPYVTGSFGGRILCSHLQRVFYAGFNDRQLVKYSFDIPTGQTAVPGAEVDATDPQTLYLNKQAIVWTDPMNPFAVRFINMAILGSNYDITGMVSWKDLLFIFTENDVWVMSGQYEEEFTFRRIVEGVGCQHRAAIAAAPEGVFFGHRSGIYVTDGQAVERISDPVEYLFDPSYMIPQRSATLAGPNDLGVPMLQLERSFGGAAYVAQRRELWFPVKRRVSGEFHYALVFQLDRKAWWVAGADWNYDGITSYGQILVSSKAITTATQSTRTIECAAADFVAAGVRENDILRNTSLGLSVRVESVTGATLLVVKTWPYGTIAAHNFTVKRPDVEGFAGGYRHVVTCGEQVFCFGFDENTWSDVIHQWTDFGGVLQTIPDPDAPTTSISARTRMPFLMVSKPMLVHRSQEIFAVGLVLNWKRPPNGAYHDRHGDRKGAGTSRIYLWGAESNWNGESDVKLSYLNWMPDYAAFPLGSKHQWDTYKWAASGTTADGLLHTRRDGMLQHIEFDMRSNFVRFAIWGKGTNRALLRGLSVLYRVAGSVGGRK